MHDDLTTWNAILTFELVGLFSSIPEQIFENTQIDLVSMSNIDCPDNPELKSVHFEWLNFRLGFRLPVPLSK